MFETRTTLVTGALGFLGSHVARLLVERGERVRGLDLPGVSAARLAGVEVDVVRGDITVADDVARAMVGVSRVVHVAALYELGTRDPILMERVNVGGTANVLGRAFDLGIPAVHVSSVAALGATGEALVGEDHWSRVAPRSAYEATKRGAHEVARGLIARGARLRIAMPATIYGPGDPSMVGRAHAFLMKSPLRIGVRPGMQLCFVHVADCADGVVRVADAGVDGGEYTLAADVVTLRGWLDAFARASGRSAPRLYLPSSWVDALGRLAAGAPADLPFAGGAVRLLRDAAAMSDGQHWAFSGERARRELGWSPRSFDAGLREVAAARARGRVWRFRSPAP